jgi:hypothetical protein
MSATARAVSFSSNHVSFDVANPTSGSLVMTYSDGWSPHWQARLDSNDVAVIRSDLAYKAVVVPPGTHRVEFTYVDRLSDAVFAAHTAASIAFLLLLAIVLRSGPRRPRLMPSSNPVLTAT